MFTCYKAVVVCIYRILTILNIIIDYINTTYIHTYLCSFLIRKIFPDENFCNELCDKYYHMYRNGLITTYLEETVEDHIDMLAQNDFEMGSSLRSPENISISSAEGEGSGPLDINPCMITLLTNLSAIVTFIFVIFR